MTTNQSILLPRLDVSLGELKGILMELRRPLDLANENLENASEALECFYVFVQQFKKEIK